MGFFDKLKKKAQDAVAPSSPPLEEHHHQEEEEQPEYQQQASQQPAYDGPTFHYDGEDLPLPPGWDGLSLEDWFFKLETLRDRIMHASDERLQPMADEDGNPLDPEEVVLILEGFKSGGHYEKFRTWGVHTWARKTGSDPTNLEFKMGGIAREKIMANKAGAMSGGALAPVEDISCEQWAAVNAGIASGGNMDQL